MQESVILSQMAHATIIFEHYYKHAKEVPYNEEWVNKPGHFSDAIVGSHAPVLRKGEKVKAINTNGFRILIIGTGGRNIVVGEGYRNVRNTFYIRAHPSMFSMVSILVYH